MGFYPQPNKWQCGPFALKHALAILGIFVDERPITKVAGSTRAGTDERKLAKAARHFDCRLSETRKKDEDKAYEALTKALAAGHPCLLCINGWSHWITIVAHDRKTDRFVELNSLDETVVRTTAWGDLKKRWVYRDAEGDQEVKLFDLYVLHPRFKATSAAQFTLERARFLQRRSNAHLLAQFDQYLSDLLGIATSVARLRTMETLSMAEFLRRHQKMLIATVQAWPHKATDAQLRRILKNMRFVAETYGLVIRAEDEKRSIAAFAALLMSWATDDKILQEVL